jgi:hypothetical protein
MTMISERSEDLLKAIYELQLAHADERVSTSSLAQVLGVADASVTGLLKKLALYKPKLIEYRRYRGVILTEAGKRKALKRMRYIRKPMHWSMWSRKILAIVLQLRSSTPSLTHMEAQSPSRMGQFNTMMDFHCLKPRRGKK